eukprot:2533862-Amphidinium_carterae.1
MCSRELLRAVKLRYRSLRSRVPTNSGEALLLTALGRPALHSSISDADGVALRLSAHSGGESGHVSWRTGKCS